MVAFVFPKGGKRSHQTGLMDLSFYEDWTSRIITTEQAEAIAAWQIASIEAPAKWSQCWNARSSGIEEEAVYGEWEVIYERQQDAYNAMTRTFQPRVAS